MQLPFTENRISVFSQHQLCPDKNHYINCMKHIDNTKKWTLPWKTSAQKQFRLASPVSHKTDTQQFHN